MDIEMIALICQAQLAAAGIEFDDECLVAMEQNLSSGTTYVSLKLNADGSHRAVFEFSGYQILGYRVLSRQADSSVAVVEQVVI